MQRFVAAGTMRVNMAAAGLTASYIFIDDVNIHNHAAKTFEAYTLPHPFVGFPLMGTLAQRQPACIRRKHQLYPNQLIAFWIPHPKHQHPLYIAKVLKLFQDDSVKKMWIRLRYYGTEDNQFGKVYRDGRTAKYEENRLLEPLGDVDGLVIVHWGSNHWPVLTSSGRISAFVLKLAVNDLRLQQVGASQAISQLTGAAIGKAKHWNGTEWE